MLSYRQIENNKYGKKQDDSCSYVVRDHIDSDLSDSGQSHDGGGSKNGYYLNRKEQQKSKLY